MIDLPDGRDLVVHGDNATVLPLLPDASFQLVYIDPPFNTGKTQKRTTLTTVKDAGGDRVGFKGQTYSSTVVGSRQYGDAFDDYLAFLEPKVVEARRLLTESGTFYLHLDYREVHYVKVMLDRLFSRDCFLNEIIWAYDYGARARGNGRRSTTRFSCT
jgi:site-specific DNA-methyltransferase (adenine-specific)